MYGYIPIQDVSSLLNVIRDFGPCNCAKSVDEKTNELPIII